MTASFAHRQGGASMTEFLIAAPVLALLGLGTIQAGLAYHGKTTLNYATFEAARTGAVNHALLDDMRDELGTRLAPMVGGDGSEAAVFAAIAKARVLMASDPFTTIEILNPSLEAFERYQVRSRESGRQVIPNSHLRHQSRDVDAVSGVSLQDANLLKIRVKHGFDLKVPLAAAAAAAVMPVFDPANAAYYAAGKLPLTSVATVRMQSEAWSDSLVAMATAGDAGDSVAQTSDQTPAAAVPEVPAADADAGDANGVPSGSGQDGDAEGPPIGEGVDPLEIEESEPPLGDGEAETEDSGDGSLCEEPYVLANDPLLPTINAQSCAAGVPGSELEEQDTLAASPMEDAAC